MTAVSLGTGEGRCAQLEARLMLIESQIGAGLFRVDEGVCASASLSSSTLGILEQIENAARQILTHYHPFQTQVRFSTLFLVFLDYLHWFLLISSIRINLTLKLVCIL